jgi:hypothetical protein
MAREHGRAWTSGRRAIMGAGKHNRETCQCLACQGHRRQANVNAFTDRQKFKISGLPDYDLDEFLQEYGW